MAKLPTSLPMLVDRFGPHVHTVPPGGWAAVAEPDRVVKTHCCFCGQQCGIQLKVKDNKVIGFEPWEDFPFNLGKLCPKGIKRYLQGDHPDRLLTPLERAEGEGFRPISWDTALGRTAAEIRRIQEEHGPDAFAILTGASLTNEKAYLMGKFARVAVRTANIDYNGRLCMVSAAAASKKILTHPEERSTHVPLPLPRERPRAKQREDFRESAPAGLIWSFANGARALRVARVVFPRGASGARSPRSALVAREIA